MAVIIVMRSVIQVTCDNILDQHRMLCRSILIFTLQHPYKFRISPFTEVIAGRAIIIIVLKRNMLLKTFNVDNVLAYLEGGDVALKRCIQISS